MFLVRVAEGYLVKYISIKKNMSLILYVSVLRRCPDEQPKENVTDVNCHTHILDIYVPLQKYKTTKFNGTKDLEVKAYVKME